MLASPAHLHMPHLFTHCLPTIICVMLMSIALFSIFDICYISLWLHFGLFVCIFLSLFLLSINCLLIYFCYMIHFFDSVLDCLYTYLFLSFHVFCTVAVITFLWFCKFNNGNGLLHCLPPHGPCMLLVSFGLAFKYNIFDSIFTFFMGNVWIFLNNMLLTVSFHNHNTIIHLRVCVPQCICTCHSTY